MQHVLFDFDGVIVNTLSICHRITSGMRKVPPSLEEYLGYFDGNVFSSVDDAGERAFSSVSVDDPFFVQYIPELMGVAPVPGMPELLRDLHDARTFRCAVISSTVDAPISAYLAKHGINHVFDGVYGSTTHKSKEVKIAMAMERFGATRANTLLVTDTLGDIREAEKVGVRSVGVSWGFHSTQRLIRGRPMVIVDTPASLRRLLFALE